MARIPPQAETRAVRSLSVVVTTLMVVLAIAALAGAATLRHVDLDWRAGLDNRWTVELPNAATATQTVDPALPGSNPAGPNSAEEAAPAADGPHAVAVLRGIPGILDATIVGPDEVVRLLGPWLGDTAAIRELPLPTLIDLRLDPANPPRLAAVEYQIANSLPGARLDDHGAWTGDLTRLARTGEVLGLVLFAIIAVAAIATVAVAARARLAINRPEIQLLHRIGASDFYVIRQFQIDAVRSAALGAILGTLLAAGAGLALLRKGTAFAPLLPRLRLETLDWCALAAVPVGAVLIAMFVAQATAWSLVRRLP